MLRFALRLFLAVAALSSPVFAQQGLLSQEFTATGTGNTVPLFNTAIVYNQITWNSIGTAPSACTVALDSSADGVTWTAGGVISGQSCTSNGQSALSSSTVVNYIRVHVTALTTTGTGIQVTWTGYTTSGGGSVTPAAAQPQFGSYTFYLSSATNCLTPSASGTTVCARNNSTGMIDYSGTDAAVVINSAIGNVSGTCGDLSFKDGAYPINSVTQETTGGYSNWYYAVGIPPNTGSANNYCEWAIHAETANSPIEALGTLQTSGVIFNCTATCVTSAGGATHFITVFWPRPDTTNSLGAQVRYSNFTVRFPNNQRCYEYGINNWEAMDVDAYNLNFDFASQAFTSTVAPCNTTTEALAGITSTKSVKDLNRFVHLNSYGYYCGVEFDTEHVDFQNSAVGWTTYPICAGVKSGTQINDNQFWEGITAIHSINGPLLGSQFQPGSLLDVEGFNQEIDTSGAYAGTGLWTETNLGATGGIIHETYYNSTATAHQSVPIPLFGAGGSQFQVFDALATPAIAQGTTSDNFAYGGSLLSGAWVPCSTTACTSSGNDTLGLNTTNVTIVNANMTPDSGAPSSFYESQNFGGNQYAKVTVAAIDATGLASVLVRGTPSTRTFYAYSCSVSGTGIIAKRGIYKLPGNTNLVQTASNSGCSANDTLELDVVTDASGHAVLNALYNGVADLNTTDSSSPILTGFPGIQLFEDTTKNGSELTTWSGGPLHVVLSTAAAAVTGYSK